MVVKKNETKKERGKGRKKWKKKKDGRKLLIKKGKI